MNFSGNWENLSGKENWNGLLNPLNFDLRRYIIHYGQLAGACGDLFKSGMRADANLYMMVNGEKKNQVTYADFFQKACLEKGNQYKYKVTKFIEAASGTVPPTWFAYVAVSDGEAAMGRLDILIAWRGTATRSEWKSNAKSALLFNKDIFKNEEVKVHAGFLSIYSGKREEPPYFFVKSARDQVKDEVEKLLNKEEHRNKKKSITVTGFSLGAALATINAVDIVVNESNVLKSDPSKSYMVTAFVFGGPHVGNDKFKEAAEGNSNLHILRIINDKDPVPKLLSGTTYFHVGKKLRVDSSKSTHMKRSIFGKSLDSSDPLAEFLNSDDENDQQVRTGRGISFSKWLSYHNMDVYLHAVAGFQGTSPFLLSVPLDTALVDKHLDILKREDIPGYWWSGEDRKYMIQQDDGKWRYERPK